MPFNDLLAELIRKNLKPKKVGSDELKLDHIEPKCGDRRGRLYFNVSKRMGWCHNCGKAISAKRFERIFGVKLETISSLESLEESMQWLYHMDEKKEPDHVSIRLPKTVPAYKNSHVLWYLTKRGVTDRQVKEYGIRYCEKGDYEGRVIIPIVDHNYNLISFVARSINDGEQKKYVYPHGTDVTKTLFGLYRFKEEKRIIFVEGVFDFFAIEPFHPVVATFGKAFPVKRASILKETNVEEIGIMWDSDAQKESARARKALEKQFNVSVISLPEGRKDPGEMNEREIKKTVRFWIGKSWMEKSMGLGGGL